MKQQIKSLALLLWQCLRYLFCKKVFLFCEPSHPNLGDQAQLMCTEKWIKEKYAKYQIVKVGYLFMPFDCHIVGHILNIGVWKYLILKLFVRKEDIFIAHSGYFFVDHHTGWFTYYFLLQHFHNRMVILPQTINFYTPVVKQMVSRIFSDRKNLTILCRDEVSYKNAQELFTGTKLLLYPDIVTSMVGIKQYSAERDGVLFCMRNDIEAFYKPEEIDELMAKFTGYRTDKIDTTIKVSEKQMAKHRDELIWSMIEKISTFKVVITDRYHGTIFSAIASTPVIVINSADHKLSSGVNWFINEGYGDAVQYAESLEDAYKKAMEQLLQKKKEYNNPTYFAERYWERLKG